MTDLAKIQSLLAKVEAIGVKYSGIAEREQYDFNVFSILREPDAEVGLHSAFLAAILNPDGGHGQGKWFLNEFLIQAGLERVPEESEAQVFREYTRLRNETTGSERDSIDIFIKVGERAIVIENKIYAEDQDEQIKRYVQFACDKGYSEEKVDVIYLTLDGHEPSSDSLCGYDIKKVKLMSYGEDVIPWLKKCIEHMAKHPTTRETLVLYQRIVQGLTGKSMNEGEIMEIAEHLGSSKENMHLVRKIEEAYSKAKATTQLKFWVSLEEALEKHLCKLPYQIMGVNDKASQKYDKTQVDKFYSGARPRPWYGIKIHLGTLNNTIIDICFMIEVEHNIYYGFIAQERDKEWGEREKLHNDTKDKISAICKAIGYDSSTFWMGWRYPQVGKLNLMNFDKKSDEMADNQLRSEYVKNLAQEIIDAIQDFRNIIEEKQIVVTWKV